MKDDHMIIHVLGVLRQLASNYLYYKINTIVDVVGIKNGSAAIFQEQEIEDAIKRMKADAELMYEDKKIPWPEDGVNIAPTIIVLVLDKYVTREIMDIVLESKEDFNVFDFFGSKALAQSGDLTKLKIGSISDKDRIAGLHFIAMGKWINDDFQIQLNRAANGDHTYIPSEALKDSIEATKEIDNDMLRDINFGIQLTGKLKSTQANYIAKDLIKKETENAGEEAVPNFFGPQGEA